MTEPDNEGTTLTMEMGRLGQLPILPPAEYRLLVEHLGEAVIIVQNEQIQFFNPRVLEISGYSAGELTSASLPDFIHPADREMVLGYHRKRLKGDSVPSNYTFRVITRTEGVKWVENRAIVIDWEGQPASLNFLTDISERKRTEEALKASEAALRTIFNNVYDAIFIHTLDGTIVNVNDKMLEMYGVTREQALTLSIAEDYSARDNPLQNLPDVWQKVAAGEEQFFQWKARRPTDGSVFDVEMFLRLLSLAGQPFIMATVRDITERLRTEQELRRQRQELETILDAIPAYIYYKDRDHRLMRVNAAYARGLNLPRSALIGKKIRQVLPGLDEELVKRYYEDDDEVMKSGKPKRGVIDRHPHVEAERWTQTEKVPYRDREGNIIGVIGLSIDITERLKAEESLRRYAEELQVRNEELDAFAYTVAHDLKNPLNVLTNMAEILATDHTTLPAQVLKGYLEAIARSGRKAINIIEALLLLAGVRRQEVELVPLDMPELIAEVKHRLAPMIREYQASISAAPQDWPVALGYPPWIEEVWANYFSNAIKYGGRPPLLEVGAEAVSDNMVRFWVRDNGPGLTLQEQDRLFRPFMQLDPTRAEGYGLGLSIVQRIVKRLGGQVGVESEGRKGRGSMFSFTLPLASNNGQSAQE